MTVTPAAANRGACAREVVAPAENSAMSSPVGSACAASSTMTSRAVPGQGRAGRPGGGEEPDLLDREVPLRQHPPHHAADLPGRADHADPQTQLTSTHLPVPAYTTASSSLPRSNALCNARTAVSSSTSRTSTEIRISEVEMMSMFTPASASASQNVAVTPGCERMPAPISDTLPTWSL